MSHNSKEVKLQVSNEEYEDHSFPSVPTLACSAIKRAGEQVNTQLSHESSLYTVIFGKKSYEVYFCWKQTCTATKHIKSPSLST